MKKIFRRYKYQLPEGSRWRIMRFWDPLLGCTPCSPGCRICSSARTLGHRKNEVVSHVIDHWQFNNRVLIRESELDQVHNFKQGEEIFVCGRSDIFHEQVPSDFVWKIINSAKSRPDCTFFAITKRPHRFKEFNQFPSNFWVSISVENQKIADERIPFLDNVKAIKIISVKPMLGSIDFTKHWRLIDMIIVGGEYGRGARPMYPDWPRHIRDQCLSVNKPFSFHNWGLWLPGEGRVTRYVKPCGTLCRSNETSSLPVHIHESCEDGSYLDGVRWDQYPA